MSSNRLASLNKKDYITDPEMHEVHYARNKGFSFIPSEDNWMLDEHVPDSFSLACLHESESEYKLLYLKVLAYLATFIAPNTFLGYFYSLKSVEFPANINEFKQRFVRLSEGEQKKLRSFYNHCKKLGCSQLIPFADYISEVKIFQSGSNFLDPEKGAYTDKENSSISYAFRVTTDKLISAFSNLNQIHTSTQVNQLAILVAFQLLRGVTRRPSQLVQLKWSDVRAIGVGFDKSIKSPELKDLDAIHIRFFKSKRGDFRGFAEKRSIRLSEQLSALLILYRHHYLKTFIEALTQQGINLNKVELTEIISRLPIFPTSSIFTLNFKDKETLFKSLSIHNKSLHKTTDALKNLLNTFSKLHFALYLQSERIDSTKIKVSNNRIRHTVLTNGARKGMIAAELAAITGVTIYAVKAYVDLTNEARADIDNAMLNNKILNSFGRISVVELQSQTGFMQLNEFDEEVAVISAPHDCSGCSSGLSKPLGCYPCHNFKPLVDANHHYYLEKAERKLVLNSALGVSPTATRKLTEVIIYIKETIKACEAWKCKIMETNL